MKAWPNWQFNEVDIVPLYELEKKLFGININEIRITPNEYLIGHYTNFTDVVCGIFYLSWIPLPLLFAFYLYSKNKNLFLRFCLAFFIVNILGFIIYYVHPAAPPWYYESHGRILDVNTKGNAAGLLRIDHFFGVTLFEGIYSKGSNVFAAMPSLHASYPLVGLVYAILIKNKGMSIIFFIFMIGIWFSAIYLNHHYILDILAGICCGAIGIIILEKVLLKNKSFNKFLFGYERIISKNKLG
jgi:membrane-associated phospholipid phosphatase